MNQYNSLNVELFNSQLNKLKPGIKTGTEATLNLTSNVTSESKDETIFQLQLSLTEKQVSRICKAFRNNSSLNIKLSTTNCLT